MLDPNFEAFLTAARFVFIGFCFVGMSVFVFLWLAFYRWRKRRAGRAVLYTYLSLLTVSALGLLSSAIPDYFLKSVWSFLGWLFFAFSVAYLIYALLRSWNAQEDVVFETRSRDHGNGTDKLSPEGGNS